MKKISVVFVLAFIIGSALWGKSTAPAAQNGPKSVVALSKSVAEMWLLAGGTVSGTTQDSLELDFAGAGVKVIGTLTSPNLEAILSLNPDFVILTNDIPAHKKIRTSLKELKIETYVVDVKDFADYKSVMKDFTELTGRSDLFRKNVLEVEEKCTALVNEFSNWKKENGNKGNTVKAPTYLLVRASATKTKVLSDHFANEIFQAYGLESITPDKSLLDELNLEALVRYDPDYIFVVAQGDEKKAAESFKKSFQEKPAWKYLSAVKNSKVFVLPKNLFNYKPNAAWADAYLFVLDILRGKTDGQK